MATGMCDVSKHMGTWQEGGEATKNDNARVKRRLFLDYVYSTLDVIGEEAVVLAHLYFARDVNGEEAVTVLSYLYFARDVNGEEAVTVLAYLYFARDVNGEEAVTVLAYLYFARDVIGEAVPVFAYRYDTRSCDWRRWALHIRHPRTRSTFYTVWQPIPSMHDDFMVVGPVLRSPCSWFSVCFKRDGKIAAAMQEARTIVCTYQSKAVPRVP
jgi:hypothetical protein